MLRSGPLFGFSHRGYSLTLPKQSHLFQTSCLTTPSSPRLFGSRRDDYDEEGDNLDYLGDLGDEDDEFDYQEVCRAHGDQENLFFPAFRVEELLKTDHVEEIPNEYRDIIKEHRDKIHKIGINAVLRLESKYENIIEPNKSWSMFPTCFAVSP
eukprot:TRINITY_DN9631_c0_g4_i1.p1 TRINITY_DN9631_c0_g4~~TRINITY_DN9631_c0_g4_i1.p1  ORF type:complete len:153 (-),score=23.23 TRINITY_DN9631_c0_g4_i1:228-686(-)